MKIRLAAETSSCEWMGEEGCCLDSSGLSSIASWLFYLEIVMFRCEACYMVLLLYLEKPASSIVPR